MNFLLLAKERYSVRKYSTESVERDKIDAILKAAQLAPTAVNYQPFKVFVLESEEALKKARSICRSTYGAPLIFLICSNENETWKSETEYGYTSGEMDASIVCTFMMMEAQDQGLGTCWVRLFSVSEMQRAFDLPDYLIPRCLLLAGYPAEDAKPYAPWHDVYKPLSEISKIL